jgi:uncharacterized BrkB/YihY/UPF0761 family membrane protein
MKEASYTETIIQMYHSGAISWERFAHSKNRLILLIILLVYLTYIVYDSFISMFDISLFNGGSYITIFSPIIGIALMIFALTLPRGTFIFAIIGTVLILFVLKYTSWILIIFGTYFLYKILEVRRIKKLIKFAKMTPDEIAKIKKSKKTEPRVELTVRGEE